jgi:hypothetical protein
MEHDEYPTAAASLRITLETINSGQRFRRGQVRALVRLASLIGLIRQQLGKARP